MTVFLVDKDNYYNSKEKKVIEKFISFLSSQLPIQNDLKIFFMSKKTDKMTTGSSSKNHKIYVLVKNRLLIDVLRTLSHEWVHEFQRPIPKNQKVKKIGGLHENMANILSGIFLKQFQSKYPKLKKIIYGES